MPVDNRDEEYRVWLTPQQRDWILVGLADARESDQPRDAATGGDVPGPNRSSTAAANPDLPRDSELQMPQVRSLPEPDDHGPRRGEPGGA